MNYTRNGGVNRSHGDDDSAVKAVLSYPSKITLDCFLF